MASTKKLKTAVSVYNNQPLIVPDDDVEPPPEDTISLKIMSLRIMDEDPSAFTIKATFQDQTILEGEVMALDAKSPAMEDALLIGTLSYDPSDFERMSKFADSPLNVSIVQVLPHTSLDEHSPVRSASTVNSKSLSSKGSSLKSPTHSPEVPDDAFCCNVDILNLFIDQDQMKVEKRMEPLFKPTLLNRKSWDNLPLLVMELEVHRDPELCQYHKILKRSNYLKFTLVAAYNTLFPYEEEFNYTAATKIPMHNNELDTVIFRQGLSAIKRFDGMCFYPKWESLLEEDKAFVFNKSDKKFVARTCDLQNCDNIQLDYYMKSVPCFNTVIWGSFHRTLFLEQSEKWLWSQIRNYNWPLEVHIFGEKGGFSFMAFLDLFHLLYPGEVTVKLAVPLQWINATVMMNTCGCEPLLTPCDKAPTFPFKQLASLGSGTGIKSGGSEIFDVYGRPTGSDENCAFVVIEVQLRRPLKKIHLPPHIPDQEIISMLESIEQKGEANRKCTGRGQQDRNWHTTTVAAANSLRRIPHYSLTEFCIFYRQLSETRTRVEMSTSFWQDAAVYVNNNFQVHEFMRSEKAFEEMLMMAHACLTKKAIETLVGVEKVPLVDPLLLAARQARQMQDVSHATDLYLQLVTQWPRDGSSWRQLAVCLLDVDRDWANVCMNKSIVLNPRHPLSLLAKGGMVFDEDPALAEPFFVALLANNPRWITLWVITRAYYIERELFHVADKIHHCIKQTLANGLVDNKVEPRLWNYELGDWWDNTPLLPGMSRYLDAADLLLRLRAITLAEACLGRALVESSQSAAYFHLVALCCRLRGDYKNALCHVQEGIQTYGEISYLRSLEAECHHKLGDIPAATESFKKASSSLGPYNTLLSVPIWEAQRARTMLVDLVRRQPSAYSWMALADDWMARAQPGEAGDGCSITEHVPASECARACAVTALQWDRRVGRAWALLAKLVHPSARRLHCNNMVAYCGYISSEEREEYDTQSKQSLCFQLGKSLRECRCMLCKYLHI